MRHYARPRYPYAPLYREVYGLQKVSPSDHIRSLSEYLQIAKYIRPKESRMNRPVLRHPDLQRNNILVSDSLEIRGIIDWQHCTILPLFLHAWIPTDFQNYGDIDSLQLAKPQLPENYDQLDPEQQDEARELYRRRQLHFFYMGYTAEINEHHYDAMNLNQIVLRQQLFRHAASPWEGDNVRLKTDLIRATQAWRELATTEDGHIPECPLSYSEAEVERCLQQWSEQHDADKNTETVRRTLGINIDGWVPLEGYDWAKQLNQALKAQAIEWAETELERGELQNHWPFDDHDEDGQD